MKMKILKWRVILSRQVILVMIKIYLPLLNLLFKRKKQKYLIGKS